MRKLFSFLIICFVLCFGSVVFAFDTVPTFVTNVANSAVNTFNMSDYKVTALNYVIDNLGTVLDSYDYAYLCPNYGAGFYGNTPTSASYYFIACNKEPALISNGTSRPNNVTFVFNESANFTIYKFDFDLTSGSISNVRYGSGSTVYNSNGYYIFCNGNNPINWNDGSTSEVIWFALALKSSSSYYAFNGTDTTPEAFYNRFISKTGDIKYWTDDTYSVKSHLSDTATFHIVSSRDFFDISISRDNLDLISNGVSNFYTYTNINFKFSDFFINNHISDNAKIWYTLIINDLNYAIIPITEAVNGFTPNVVTFNINNKPDILNSLSGGLTFVCWYCEDDVNDVRLGQTAYQFNVFANNTTTGTSPTGNDNTTTVTGYNNNMPINIYNNIREQDGLDAAGINTGVNLDYFGLDTSNSSMRGRFSAMFDFFSVAFAWLPSEIIVMVKTGFAIAVIFIIYKIIRG